MLDFRSIETFLWVVKLGSFRGAAQRLNTTQPAISQRIAQLERELGVKLLNRDHRVASPTASGRQMLVYAEKLIGLRAEMLAEVGDRSAMRGVLRLGVAETIVHDWLPRLIKSVNESYPNLSLEIEVDVTPNLHARLLAQEIELAFALGAPSESGIRSRVLAITRSASWPALPWASARASSRPSRWHGFRSSPSRATPSPMTMCALCSTGRICRRCGCTPAPRWRPSSTWRSRASVSP